MNAAEGKQSNGHEAGDEQPSEDRESWDADYEAKEPRAGFDADRYLDDPRHGQARVLNRRIE